MNEVTGLVVACLTAKNKFQIDEILVEHAEHIGWKPVGGIATNSGPIHMLKNPYDCLNEILVNGLDSVIENKKKIFPEDVSTATHALDYLATNGSEAEKMVFLFAAPAHDKDHSVVQVTDTGVGIPAENFHSTILSINAGNKISNNLSIGCYNMGGSAIHSQGDFNTIISTTANSNEIAFTLIKRTMRPDWKAPSYEYMTYPNGSIITITREDLLEYGADIVKPEDVNKDNCEIVLRNAIIVPDHGVTRRIVNIKVSHFSDQKGLFSYIPNKLFGNPVPIHMVALGGSSKPVYNLNGTRRRLDAVFGAKTRWNTGSGKHTGLHKISKNVPIGQYGSIEITAWVMDSYTNQEKKIRYAKDTFCFSMDNNKVENIFCTRYGQTQGRMRSKFHCKHAGVPFIENNTIFEVNMDNVTNIYDVTSSDRTSLTDEFAIIIGHEIEKFLTGHEIFAQANNFFRQKEVFSEKETDTSLVVSKLSQFLTRPLAGSIFKNFNFFGQKPSPNGKLKDEITPPPPKIITTMNPTFIEIRKNSIIMGEQEWCPIRTDADNSFAESIKITKMPTWLKVIPNQQKVLSDGHLSLMIECDPNVSVGDTGLMTVELTANGRVLQDTTVIRVVDARQSTKTPKPPKTTENSASNMHPDISVHWGNIYQKSGQGFNVDTLEQSDWSNIAYYINDTEFSTNNTITIHINDGFAPFNSCHKQIVKQYGIEVGNQFRQSFEEYLVALALGYAEEFMDEDVERTQKDMHKANSANAKAGLVSILMHYQNAGSTYANVV